jgi:histone deacetylase complex regulatory component SIN3
LSLSPCLVQLQSSRDIFHYKAVVVHKINVECCGRDEMCKSVLNDKWVLPSELLERRLTPSLWCTRRTLYVEALRGRNEEERHEYDFHTVVLGQCVSTASECNARDKFRLHVREQQGPDKQITNRNCIRAKRCYH